MSMGGGAERRRVFSPLIQKSGQTTQSILKGTLCSFSCTGFHLIHVAYSFNGESLMQLLIYIFLFPVKNVLMLFNPLIPKYHQAVTKYSNDNPTFPPNVP